MPKLHSSAGIVLIGCHAVREKDIADTGVPVITDIGNVRRSCGCWRRAWDFLYGSSGHAGVLLSLEWMISCPMGQ